MNEDPFGSVEFAEFFVDKGWEEMDDSVSTWEFFAPVLSDMVGDDPAKRIRAVIEKQDYIAFTPQKFEVIENSLSACTGGIAHFWQVGASSAMVPAHRPIFKDLAGGVDPVFFGSFLFLFHKPAPLEMFSNGIPGLHRTSGWIRECWQLAPVNPDVDIRAAGYPRGTHWIPADVHAPGFSRTPDMGAIRGVMVSVVPPSFEKNLLYTMDNNNSIVYHLVNKVRPGLGMDSRFKSLTTPAEAREKVVHCKADELYMLLSCSRVPQVTKFYSVYANLFPYTAMAVCALAEPVDFTFAKGEWSLTSPLNVPAKSFQIAVALYLLGACYTIKGHIAKQITRRLNACRSALGLESVSETDVGETMTQSGFKEGLPNSMAARIVGIAVAVVSKDKADPNTLKKNLLSVPEVGALWELDDFVIALYTQLRLVAEKLQSSTIRFALGGLPSLTHVDHCTPDYIKREAKDLRELKDQLVDRPYTGCTDPIPAKFTVATYPHLCYYGVKVYEASLSEKGKEEFKHYKVAGIIEKMDSNNKRIVDALIGETPTNDDVTTVGFIAMLDLAAAESYFDQIPDSKKQKVKEMLMKSTEPSEFRDYLLEQRRMDCLNKVNDLLKNRIKYDEEIKVQLVTQKIENSSDDQEKTVLKAQRQEIQNQYAHLRAMCVKPDAAWEKEVSPAALAMWNDYYKGITKDLKELGEKILI